VSCIASLSGLSIVLFVFVLFLVLPVSLDCDFFIAPSVFSDVYLTIFIPCYNLILLQPSGGKDETNVNKTRALLQTSGGKDETNVNKTRALLQTSGGKDETNIILCASTCL
jgi:hypothetical protein